MSILRRRPRVLPRSVPAFDPVPWVQPEATAPPWWRRGLSAVQLALLVVVLGIVLAVSVAIVLLASFFVVDYVIS